MCLSTVYANDMSESNMLIDNIMNIECKDDKIILTDLMERKHEYIATLKEANLVDGYVVLNMN